MMKRIRYFLYGFAALFLLWLYYLAAPATSGFAFPDNRIWAHRQNTIEAVDGHSAGSVGGLEMDIWNRNGVLINAHDESEVETGIPLAEHLKQIAGCGPMPNLWFDLKNIERSNELEFRDQITALMQQYQLEGKLLVESRYPFSMTRLCQEEIHCSIWLYGSGSLVRDIWNRLTLPIAVQFLNVASVSVDYRNLPVMEKSIPENWPILLFTFDNPKQAEPFMDNGRYRILLSD
jgi:hypothetical protein